MAQPEDTGQLPDKGATTVQKIPNVLLDSALAEIRRKMIQQGYSELHLPPSENQFSERTLGIVWHGTLVLTNGILRGLDTLRRVGEATLSFNEYLLNGATAQHAEITFTVDLGLTLPTTTHDFRVTFMKKEMDGVVTGTLSDVTFNIVLGLNIMTRKMRLIHMKFKHVGHINTQIKGLGAVLDFLASKITKIMLNRTKWDMANVVEAKMRERIIELVDNTKWPLPDQQNLLIGGMQNVFGGSSSGGGENGGGAEAGSSKQNR